MSERLSLAEARRIALAAQGFGLRPAASDRRKLSRAVEHAGALQIDSVNVLVRSHYLPAFSREGAYDRAELDRAQHGRRRTLIEYWAHEASLVPAATWPLLRWRMAAAEEGEGIYGGLARFADGKRTYINSVLREVERRGPLAASELEGEKGAGGWWGWSDAKRALEWLFWTGRVTTAARRNFERLYDLPERVLPAGIAEAEPPSRCDAQLALQRIAARAYGIATERDLRDYWRMPIKDARARLNELVEDGALRPVQVEGWGREPAYLDAEARRPRAVEASALLSPFDSLVWFRPRAERLWDFRYRLELYTPEAKRVHGYYVLPFLHRERLQARVDLKADRQAGALLVHGVHLEPDPDDDADEAMGAQLRAMAAWLGLAEVRVTGRRGVPPGLLAHLDG